jgi:outer membrane protein OmpA-like peptidoglycan-associated protein
LNRTPRIQKVRIEGYTDGSGDAGYNLDLSYRRARAVQEYLISQGVDRRRLTFIGYGETRPVASDATPEGEALNRRVEFTIVESVGDVGQGGAEPERPRRRHRRHRGAP